MSEWSAADILEITKAAAALGQYADLA